MSDASRLRSFVERVENLREEIRGLNSDVADLYKEAKSAGFDPQGIKDLVAHRRDPDKAEKRGATFGEYLALLGAHPSKNAPAAISGRLRAIPEKPSRVRVHEPETAVKVSRGQPSARDGETWPVESLVAPGPSIPEPVLAPAGEPVAAVAVEPIEATGSLIEAAPPRDVGAEDGDAAMPVTGHWDDPFNTIPEFLRRPLPEVIE